MRTFWKAFLILGFFHPLVIQAEPFGTTEVTVFDTDFLPAPQGPVPEDPGEPPEPGWVAVLPQPVQVPCTVPPILLPELPS